MAQTRVWMTAIFDVLDDLLFLHNVHQAVDESWLLGGKAVELQAFERILTPKA